MFIIYILYLKVSKRSVKNYFDKNDFFNKILSAFFILSVFQVFLFSLDPDIRPSHYIIRGWDQSDGLPQNTVTDLIQTRDGYLWIGTEEGLARFNGREFRQFTKYNTKEIKNDDITSFWEDKEGNLWIGTRRGLLKYRNGKFTLFDRKNGLEHDFIRSLGFDGYRLFIGTDSGLFIMENESFKSVSGFSGSRILVIKTNGIGSLLVGTENGLFLLKKGKKKRVFTGMGITDNIITEILPISKSNFLIGTLGSGIIEIDNGKILPFSQRLGMSKKNIEELFKDSDGNLWVLYDKSDSIIRVSRKRITKLKVGYGLKASQFRSIYEDKEKNLWIGTLKGLNVIMDSKIQVFSQREGLRNDEVGPVFERNGTIWIGYNTGGIDIMRGKKISPYHDEIFKDTMIVSIFINKKGNLWAGTFGRGIIRKKGNKFITINKADGLPSTKVYSIIEDLSGKIWVGTFGGLVRIDGSKIHTFGAKEGFKDRQIIYSLMNDSRGCIWICTAGGGVFKYEDGKFYNYSEKNGLSDNFVLSTYEDRQKNIWVGTSNGLNLIKRSGEISVFKKENGLYNDVGFTILEDDNGTLWMSSNKGIYSVNRKDLLGFASGKINKIISKGYTTIDGLRGNEGNGGFTYSGWKTSDGKLLFSTTSGMAMVVPDSLKIRHRIPPLKIEKVVIDGKIIEDPESRIEMDSSVSKVEIHFSVLSYFAPERNRVKFMLRGYDKKWEEMDSSREWTAKYTNLRFGNYRFILKGCNGDGIWNETPTSLQLIIKPFFWETNWFRFLEFIIFVFISYYFVMIGKKYFRILAFWKEKNYIGRYKIVKKIASGGMGTVYKARDVIDREKVFAIKTLREEYFDDEEQIKRFHNESVVTDSLDHKNIVKIYERGEYRNSIYLVMELLEGITLREVIADRDSMIGVDKILRIVLQIADALSHVHRKGVIHRDMKPGNIMILEREGEELFVKLLDFGLARVQSFTKLTQTGNIMGSIHYLSPEQFKGEKITSASDIFSFGIVFYELLAGIKPFFGETAIDIMREVLEKDPVSIKMFRNDVSEDIIDLVMKMMDKEPQKRPDATEVHERLKELI